MDYPLENLNPDKFQEFCQALVAREFPGTQVFPIGQADGGRDALVRYNLVTGNRETTVYQVKFVRDLSTVHDPRKWLKDALAGELPKIQGLIPRGARRYVLLTNVRGTGPLEAGSIDRLDQLLTSMLPIPAVCWWRDDIARRLDEAWNLKWVYPELMTGPDLIRSVFESGVHEHRDRRALAIRAFLSEQYHRDQEVRFRQVDLQNKLLDLFIDVPLEPPTAVGSQEQLEDLRHSWFVTLRQSSTNNDDVEFEVLLDARGEEAEYDIRVFPSYAHGHSASIGAATFLLAANTQQQIPRIVLEGAPGQGKSTITQYVCQVHRMHLLGLDAELRSLPEPHQKAPVRLPIRVDLRDFATWLDRRNPFLAETPAVPRDNWRDSLEGFLAALISHQSGGVDFDVADLLAVLKVTALLLVLDGLDEVADIQRRSDVVEGILRGVMRLQQNATSLQVLVTSRPAAFANSPGLSGDIFPHFPLGPVTRPLIEEYARKWSAAKRLEAADSVALLGSLKERLAQPHLRDLARNPMQLAILLSLLHTRGVSLPDKRTSLYDSYVEAFFDREAEKSPIVREHRELLIDIHRYLAWVLHTEAEEAKGTGSVSSERLQELLRNYLAREGHDTGLAERLFTGMVERVVAVVSRVEGLYEFDVQPLREYFAARHLYQTAPYSPPGAERQGTKPERFSAMARNFYWLNVTRFYAGCYSSGEFASLIDGLEELSEKEGYRLISHPRTLAATLLSDWVFTQQPRSVAQVVDLVMKGHGLRFALASWSVRAGETSRLVLPSRCGREELLEKCFSLLRERPPRDFAVDVNEVVAANMGADELVARWAAELDHYRQGNAATWLDNTSQAGALLGMPEAKLDEVLELIENKVYVAGVLHRGRRTKYLEADEDRFRLSVRAVLDLNAVADLRRRPATTTDLLAHLVEPARYASAFAVPAEIPLSHVWGAEHRRAVPPIDLERTGQPLPYRDAVACYGLAHLVNELAKRPCGHWATTLEPWERIIEGLNVWGGSWACAALGNLAAGIRSSTETYPEASDLLDKGQSLCRRIRHARLRSRAISWWKPQLRDAVGHPSGALAGLVACTWAGHRVLTECVEELNALIGSLPYREYWRALSAAERVTRQVAEGRAALEIDPASLPANLDARTGLLLTLRLNPRNQAQIFNRCLRGYEGTEFVIHQSIHRLAITLLTGELVRWNECLDPLSRAYKAGVISTFAVQEFLRRPDKQSLPRDLAERVAKHADEYPSFLVAVAERVCRAAVARSVEPVGTIAQREQWFA